jgi:hypothetical protein
MKPKQLGMAIVILSILVIVLMLFFKIQFDRQQLQACADACGDQGADSCSIDSCPYHQNGSLDWIPILSTILVAGLGGIGVFLLFSKEEKIIEQKEYDLSGLGEEEKKVFYLVKEEENGAYQSRIVDALGLSKVKVTRILDKLEQKGLVERKRRGMTNIIVLK